MATFSATDNAILMSRAREALQGKWKVAVFAALVYFVLTAGIHIVPNPGPVITVLISGPMAFGMALFSLAYSRDQPASVAQLFHGFNRFGTALVAYLLVVVLVVLWTLLLIVPGIIAAFRYSMTFFLLAEDDSLGPIEALSRSKELMEGNKWKYFCLTCRFFGWSLLAILTLGIGFLWLYPYMMVSYAQFYDDLKEVDAPTSPEETIVD